MRTPESSRVLRWLTLGAVLANITFNTLSERLHLGRYSMQQQTERYRTLFTPASYAFSIWGVIYAAFFAYAVAQLWPSQRSVRIYDKINPALIASNVLASVWVYVYRADAMPLTVVLIVAILGCAIAQFVLASRAVRRGETRRLLLAPFAIFLGWVSVATIANVAQLLVSWGWRGAPLDETSWSVAMLCVATGLGALVATREKTALVPAVMAWATFAIYVRERSSAPTVAATAVTAAVVSALVSIGTLVVRMTKTARVPLTTAGMKRPT